MKSKTTHFLFSVAGLVLMLVGIICVGAVVASFSNPNLVKLSEFGERIIELNSLGISTK